MKREQTLDNYDLLHVQDLLRDPIHGELYTDDDGVTVTATVAGTYYEIQSLTEGDESDDKFIEQDGANGDFTIGRLGKGLYRVMFHTSFSANKGCIAHIAIFKNGTKQDNISIQRDIANPNDVGASGNCGFLELDDTNIIDIRITSDTANTNFSIDHMNFNLERIRLR